ncbi:MAG: glycosyltransferase, partial [Acidobacteriota bacterium]|jgi:UDP-N-acetylglucosamine--N-acetylmuramyl-(pentapeptide) pyrophosphoryl-undecaprenol N-acetylglucosamine transferase|nr:glycosyltransferase [Acidobacteriota bacterium]
MEIIRRVLLTGGGTAGHVNPALAIGSVLKSEDTEFLYVGVHGRVEEEIVPHEGMPIQYVRAAPYPGGGSKLTGFAITLAIGVCQAALILLRFRPDVVIGTGSYVAAPAIIAAAILKKMWLLRSRIFLHEQNAVPGQLNKLMARFVDKVLVTFPETQSQFPGKSELVGYPLRRRIASIPREEAMRRMDFTIPDGRRVILAFGGSQGSRTLNHALIDALEYLIPYRDRLYIIHGVGLFKSSEYDAAADTGARLLRQYDASQLTNIENFYTWRPFFYDIQNLYSVSNMVIVRGGAGSLNEVATVGLPALIIPKSGLPGNHQVMNARAMERAGGAEVIYEQTTQSSGQFKESLDGKLLADRIIALALNDARLLQMRLKNRSFLNQDALPKIATIIRGEAQSTVSGHKTATTTFTATSEDTSLPGNHELLSKLEKEYRRLKAEYKAKNVIPRTEDREYFKSRADTLLTSASWQERNLGVKLLGFLNAQEKLPTMLAMFTERKRVSFLKRIFGGDYEQVGFIRRNIVTALIRLNTLTPEVEEALLAGFKDPYYEVREACALAASHFSDRITGQKPFIMALLDILDDANLDVATAAAEALGRFGGKHDAMMALLHLWDTKYWRLRASALRGIMHLVERGRITDWSMLEAQIPHFILTSTDFKPHFEIKSAYRLLMEAISKKKETTVPQ